MRQDKPKVCEAGTRQGVRQREMKKDEKIKRKRRKMKRLVGKEE